MSIDLKKSASINRERALQTGGPQCQLKVEDLREVAAVGPSHRRGATNCTVKIRKFG